MWGGGGVIIHDYIQMVGNTFTCSELSFVNLLLIINMCDGLELLESLTKGEG